MIYTYELYLDCGDIITETTEAHSSVEAELFKPYSGQKRKCPKHGQVIISSASVQPIVEGNPQPVAKRKVKNE